jgi:hypothetical protein
MALAISRKHEANGCIEACLDARRACVETAMHCLELGGQHAEPRHIGLLADCVLICQTAADFLLRGSDLHPLTCNACAIICRKCADDCGRFPGDDAMTDCAKACRKCAEECETMAGKTL